MNTQGTYAVNTRAKPGHGKLFYGMTPSTLERIKQIRLDTPAKVESHFRSLYTFTAIYIEHARALAKCGQKDEARNWYRFFSNSQVLSILEKHPDAGDLNRLREDFNFLGLECHPHDVPSFTTDLEAIYSCLTEILHHVQNTPRKKETVRRFDTRRPVARRRRHEPTT